MYQNEEERPRIPTNALADESDGQDITPDADDETAVTGNQQAGGTGRPKNDSMDEDESSTVGDQELVPQTNLGMEEASGASDNEKDDSKSESHNDPSATTTSSFAQLVKSWEAYIADTQSVDKFQPMQMLQSLRLCGAGHELPRLTLAPSTEFTSKVEGQDPFEPIVLRHTHSTPLQYRPSFFNDYESAMPPPSQLDATRRSSSTPSRGSAFQQFSARNSFGAHFHTASNLSGFGGRSAFGFPLHRSSYSGVSTESTIRGSAFNPVPFSLSATTEEEPQEEENTSIEVMDLGRSEADTKATTADEEEEKVEVEVQLDSDGKEGSDQTKPSKKSAAARAARFLSDVGVLRRKKKGARGSIVSVISSEREFSSKNPEPVVPKPGAGDEKATNNTVPGDGVDKQERESESEECTDIEELSRPAMYQQLDSDVDEEFDRYQSIENTGRSSEDSAGTIESTHYQPIEDDRLADLSLHNHDENKDVRRPAVRIQVSSNVSRVYERAERNIPLATDAASPNPGQLHEEEQSRTATPDTNSPGGTTRSSTTTTTSGHTTQATSITSTTGNTSSHSQISETDREVMEAIKEGKRRRRQESRPESDKIELDGNVTLTSSSSTSTTTNGYVALTGSPGPLRDGANVVADRFFMNSKSPVPPGGYTPCSGNHSLMLTTSGPAVSSSSANVRVRTSSLARKLNAYGSPTEETPPTFVSYLDRQATSDLTSLREAPEVYSCRGEVEEREDSPAEIIGYPAVFFGETPVADGQENAISVLPKLVLPSKERLYDMLDRFRSRPPRSPSKGMRTMTPTTPPPRLGSPAYHHQLSPPRNIIDHRIETNVSRPYVIRTNPSTQKMVLVSPGSYGRPSTPLVCIPVGSPNYSPHQNKSLLPTWPEQPGLSYGNMGWSRTYEEHSIEILKTDSKDEMICQPRFASPENDASTN